MWLLPFVKPATVAHFFPDADCSDYTRAVAAALSDRKPDPAARQVLVAHQFVTAAGSAPQKAGSESINVGGLDNVDSACFAGFDYVALGHIHKRQPVGQNAWYAGSPMAYSLDEAGQEKGALLVTLGEHGPAQVRFVPFAPLHPIRHITGPLEKLIDAAEPAQREDYIYATLTDKTPVLDAMDHLRAVYPNVMKLDYPQQTTGEARTAAADVEKKDLRELFFDFYTQVNGEPPSEEAWQAVAELAKEGGMEL